MRNIKYILVFLSFIFLFLSGMGQTYNMSNTAVSTCSGTFYDSGGSGSNYSINEDFTKTFSPSIAGNMLQFVFNSWSCESATFDHLSIYDGPNTGSPLIGTYGGTTSPGTIIATNTGDLTFVWHSDGSVTYAGWDATISCFTPSLMTYVSSTTTQASTSGVSPGDNNREILRVQVITTGTLSPLVADFIRVRTNGSTNPLNDISNIDIYYTGTSNTFATTTLFGSAAPAATGTNINIGGSQTLSEGSNYFWIVYDVQGTATPGNVLDATCEAIRIGGIAQTPSTTNPAGNRPITNTLIPTACTVTTHVLPSTSSIVFYDDGGPGGDPCLDGTAGNFCNCNCFTTVTICGAPGEYIVANFREFSMFNTTSGFDWMVIYDNSTTSGTILFDNRAVGSSHGNPPLFTTSSTTLGPDNPLGDCNYTGTLSHLCSTGNCLTFQFWGTSVVNRAGWDCLVSSVTAACTLPVELTTFDYSCLDRNTIKLEWTTATETNNDYFTIEKSVNGLDFEDVVEIDGHGNSNSEIDYEYIDNINSEHNYYYRLTQTDFDGKNETFDLLFVNCDNNGVFIGPNPAISGQPITIYGEYEKILIKDVSGRIVNAEIINNQIFGLEHGIYIVDIDGRINKIIVE